MVEILFSWVQTKFWLGFHFWMECKEFCFLQVCLYLKWNKSISRKKIIFNFFFTDDYNLGANLAHTTGEFERIAHEIDINIFGIGISLVNNTLLESNHEILYMSITSSGLLYTKNSWNLTKKKYFLNISFFFDRCCLGTSKRRQKPIQTFDQISVWSHWKRLQFLYQRKIHWQKDSF